MIPPPSRRELWIRALLLLAVAAVTFIPLAHQALNLDDVVHIGLARARSWNPAEHFGSALSGTHYSPLPSLLLKLQDRLFGDRTVPYYLFNVLFHALNAWLLGRLADRWLAPPAGSFAALAYAMLWTHFDVTAWICVADFGGLAFFFSLLALHAYVRCRAGGSSGWLAAAAFAYLAAIFSKEDALSFLPVLLGWELFMTAGRKPTRSVAAFWLVSLAASLLFVGLFIGRVGNDYYVQEKVVELRPGWHYAKNFLQLPGLILASLLVPTLTIRFLPLVLLGAVFLGAGLLLARRLSPAQRWAIWWVAAGSLPFLAFLTPCQARYTISGMAGFSLFLGTLAVSRPARLVLAALIVISFLCRLEAQGRFHRVMNERFRAAAAAEAEAAR